MHCPCDGPVPALVHRSVLSAGGSVPATRSGDRHTFLVVSPSPTCLPRSPSSDRTLDRPHDTLIVLSLIAISRCYPAGVATKTAITLDDYVYESAKACSAALGQSMTEWLNDAARAAARRQNAAAYLRWEASRAAEARGDELDELTNEASLDGAEW